jgi:drug/metabolite transporter (DMT)-like permease
MSENASPKQSRLTSEGALLLMTLLWGATFVIVKESLRDISSMLFVATRFGIAGIILFAALIFRKKKFVRKAFGPGIFLGIFLYLSFITQTIGLKYTTATNSGFITGSSVVIVPFLQFFIQKKKPSYGAIVGTILVFIGILFLSSGGNSITGFLAQFGQNFNLGDGLTLACAFFYAFHIVFIDSISTKHDNWILLFTQIITVCILALLTAIIFAGFSIEPLRSNYSNYLIFGILYTSIFTTLVTIGLQAKFQKNVTPTQAGIIYSFEPIFAAIFAFFLLNEKMSMFGLVGCALIFLGLIISMILDPGIVKEVELNG